MFGGAGDDLIHLGEGQDSATSGEGVDRFIFRYLLNVDTLTDFEIGIDQLVFDISNYMPSGPLDPSRFATAGASGPQAQFVLVHDAGAGLTRLLLDSDGAYPREAYAVAEFTGHVALTAADILIF